MYHHGIVYGRLAKDITSPDSALDQKPKDSAVFHEEVARTLVEFVADHFNLAAAGLTYDVVDELLISKGIDPALRRRFRTCLETCDFARFVPSAGASDRRAEVLEEATAAIDELEQAL